MSECYCRMCGWIMWGTWPCSLRNRANLSDRWFVVFFSSRRRHTRFDCDWSSDVCSSDLVTSVERVMEQSRASGMDPGRADSVLQNAREAIKDRRFVEAIEYKKVIEDILEEDRKSVV